MEQQVVIEKVRICINCKVEKDLVIGFRFSRRYRCYERICNECRTLQEKEIRKQRREKLLIKTQDDYKFKSKVCKNCSEEKDIQYFGFHKASGYYHNECNDCKNTKRRATYSGMTDNAKLEFENRRKEYYRRIEDRSAIVSNHCRAFDEKRGLENDLDREWVKNELMKSCVYCGFPSTGLDRIDAGIGHTKHNCIPCCRDCNVARSNHFTVEEMKIIGVAIHEVKRMRIERNENIERDYFYKGE